MSYTVLEQATETVRTKVEYDFDGQVVVVDVLHFRPQSQEAIEANIVARGETELARLQEQVVEA